MGKKIGIVALICTIIYIACCIVEMVQAPEIPDEVWDIYVKDQEAAQEKIEEIINNSSTLFKVADEVSSIVGLGGIVLSIVSIVKLIKAKEKGKIVPILCIVFIFVFFLITIFSISNVGGAFQAGLKAGMEMQE